MKILILSTTDIIGGAPRATYRLHQGLGSIGQQSSMLVQYKKSHDPSVIGPQGRLSTLWSRLRPHLDALPLKLYKNRQPTPWSLNWVPNNIREKVRQLNPDIVSLHWINNFLPVTAFAQIKQPMTWTMRDCWAFTGGCHYPFDCRRYRDECGVCPQLNSTREQDFSRWGWNRKFKYLKGLDITMVAISRWLAETAKSSSLFQQARIEVIPSGLDIKRFKPIEKGMARDIMNLPQDKRLILFGALNPFDKIKGFHLLRPALQILGSNNKYRNNLEFVVFGATDPAKTPDLDLPTHYIGHLTDDFSLALLYSAADVMVVPSMYEALGQIAIEALACGTPVVAFNTSGLRDSIDHQENGYLARPFEVADLAHGIEWVLSDRQRYVNLQRAARAKVEREFATEQIAKKYLCLFEELIDR